MATMLQFVPRTARSLNRNLLQKTAQNKEDSSNVALGKVIIFLMYG
jgi:hypothetical protein